MPVTVVSASPRGQRACTTHPCASNRTASRADSGHEVVAVMSTTTDPLDCNCDGLGKAVIRNSYYTKVHGMHPGGAIVVVRRHPDPAVNVMEFTSRIVEGRGNTE